MKYQIKKLSEYNTNIAEAALFLEEMGATYHDYQDHARGRKFWLPCKLLNIILTLPTYPSTHLDIDGKIETNNSEVRLHKTISLFDYDKTTDRMLDTFNKQGIIDVIKFFEGIKISIDNYARELNSRHTKED